MEKIILICLAAMSIGYATAQAPDLVIFNEDTLTVKRIMSTDSLFSSKRRYERKLRKQSGGRSNACSAYRHLWLIKNDSLFLESIVSCRSRVYLLDDKCFYKLDSLGVSDEVIEKFKMVSNLPYDNTNISDIRNKLETLLPKSVIDKYVWCITKNHNHPIPINYRHLLKEKYQSDNIFADFYSGFFLSEIGERAESTYVQEYYLTDKALLFEVENGIVIDTFTVVGINAGEKFQDNTKNLKGFILPVFENWIEASIQSPDVDSTFNFYDSSSAVSIEYTSQTFETDWSKGSRSVRFVETKKHIANKISAFNNNFTFSKPSYSKLIIKGGVYSDMKVPYTCSIDGASKSKEEFVKIVTIFIYNKRVTMIFKGNDKDKLNEIYSDVILKVNCDWANEFNISGY